MRFSGLCFRAIAFPTSLKSAKQQHVVRIIRTGKCVCCAHGFISEAGEQCLNSGYISEMTFKRLHVGIQDTFPSEA